jgi:two-component system sensor histidine kinase RegB
VGETLLLPRNYLIGLWIAIVCGTVFSAIYARRIAEEARQMSAALGATEMVLAREQRLSALDGLAAAAAHELGTPLATIALVAKELKREMPGKSPHSEDIELLISQTARCREILARLSNRDQASDEVFGRVKLSAMLEDLVAPLRGSDVEIIMSCKADNKAAGSPEPVLRRNPAIAYGLGNILENAIDFAATRVSVEASWNKSSLSLVVSDDGPGFDQQIFDRLGDPFVTTRPGYTEAGVAEGTHEGMGLGLFIAKTLLERSGATVTLSNQRPPARGARIALTWPREAVDIGAMPAHAS